MIPGLLDDLPADVVARSEASYEASTEDALISKVSEEVLSASRVANYTDLRSHFVFVYATPLRADGVAAQVHDLPFLHYLGGLAFMHYDGAEMDQAHHIGMRCFQAAIFQATGQDRINYLAQCADLCSKITVWEASNVRIVDDITRFFHKTKSNLDTSFHVATLLDHLYRATNNPRHHMNRGIFLFFAKNYDEAKAVFNSPPPTSTPEYRRISEYYLGKIAFDQGEFHDACAKFESCMKGKPTDSFPKHTRHNALYLFAQAQFYSGNLHIARVAAERYLSRPELTAPKQRLSIHLLLAKCTFETKDYTKIRHYLEVALAGDVEARLSQIEVVDAHLLLANCLLCMNELSCANLSVGFLSSQVDTMNPYDRAIFLFFQAYLSPKHGESLRSVIEALEAMTRYDNSDEILQLSLAARLLYLTGAGQMDEAAALISYYKPEEGAISFPFFDPSVAVNFSKGALALHGGNKEGCIEEMNRFAMSEPGQSPSAISIRAQLHLAESKLKIDDSHAILNPEEVWCHYQKAIDFAIALNSLQQIKLEAFEQFIKLCHILERADILFNLIYYVHCQRIEQTSPYFTTVHEAVKIMCAHFAPHSVDAQEAILDFFRGAHPPLRLENVRNAKSETLSVLVGSDETKLFYQKTLPRLSREMPAGSDESRLRYTGIIHYMRAKLTPDGKIQVKKIHFATCLKEDVAATLPRAFVEEASEFLSR